MVEVGDGDGLEADAGTVLGDGACDGALLRTAGEAIRAVFYVAAGDDFAVRKQERGADAEVAIG